MVTVGDRWATTTGDRGLDATIERKARFAGVDESKVMRVWHDKKGKWSVDECVARVVNRIEQAKRALEHETGATE